MPDKDESWTEDQPDTFTGEEVVARVSWLEVHKNDTVESNPWHAEDCEAELADLKELVQQFEGDGRWPRMTFYRESWWENNYPEEALGDQMGSANIDALSSYLDWDKITDEMRMDWQSVGVLGNIYLVR